MRGHGLAALQLPLLLLLRLLSSSQASAQPEDSLWNDFPPAALQEDGQRPPMLQGRKSFVSQSVEDKNNDSRGFILSNQS